MIPKGQSQKAGAEEIGELVKYLAQMKGSFHTGPIPEGSKNPPCPVF